jgi:hypothetical protein
MKITPEPGSGQETYKATATSRADHFNLIALHAHRLASFLMKGGSTVAEVSRI